MLWCFVNIPPSQHTSYINKKSDHKNAESEVIMSVNTDEENEIRLVEKYGLPLILGRQSRTILRWK